MFHVIAVFYIPLIIIIISYCLIGFSLRKQIASSATLRQDYRAGRIAQIKFLKATIAIIATFTFTWLPYQVKIVAKSILDIFLGDCFATTFAYISRRIVAYTMG